MCVADQEMKDLLFSGVTKNILAKRGMQYAGIGLWLWLIDMQFYRYFLLFCAGVEMIFMEF